MKIRTCQLLSDGLNCASLPLGVESEGNYNIGTWRSLVARFAGGEEVAGSNPVVPTIYFLILGGVKLLCLKGLREVLRVGCKSLQRA